jgi:chromate reductase, NAD(P)H dehydrogenase (quinone)
MGAGWPHGEDQRRDMKLLLVSGSLRRGSANTAAVREAERYLRTAHPWVSAELAQIGDLPFFDEDVEAEGWPLAVQRLRDQIDAADVVLVSTPEYNGSVTGVLKNAIDWVSRPDNAGPIFGKPVATMSASPTGFGARWAQENLRFVLEQCSAILVNEDMVTLPNVFTALDDRGRMRPGPEADKIHRLLDAVVTRRWACHQPSSRPA